MKFSTRSLFTGGILILGLAMSQAYTNCAPAFQMSMASDGPGISALTVDHPAPDKIQAPQANPPLAHRGYIEALMLEVFIAPSSPAGYVNELRNQVRKWATFQSAQVGQACNTYETPSGRDCGGDPSNANLPLNQSDTVVREALRIHLCEEVMGHDEAIAAALSKVPDAGAEPTPATVAAMSMLFYRGDGAQPAFLEVLSSMDKDLKAANTSNLDRWRMMLMQTCEASDWQLL